MVAHPAALPSAAGAVGDATGTDADADRDAQILRGIAGHHRYKPQSPS